jgi:phosphoglycolate phosphatase
MINPALLVFDIDGTLFQTDKVTVPAVQQVFAAYGLAKPSAEKIGSFFGQPVQDYEDWLAEQAPDGNAAALVEATNIRELELVGEAGELYPGAREVLESLAADGHTLAVSSNGPDPYVAEFVRAHKLTALFSKVVARDSNYDGKITMTAEILDELPARPLVIIGDRRDDIEAARAHGGFGIAATYGFSAPGELENANAAISAITELPGVLETLSQSPLWHPAV